MRISDLVLTQHEAKAGNGLKELNVTRIILLLCSTFTLLLRYMFIQSMPDTYDPLWIRITFSSLLIFIFLLTYFNKLRPIVLWLTLIVFALNTFHGMVLIQNNGFSIPYILEFVILLILICLAFENKNLIYFYLLVVMLGYSILCFISMKATVDIFVNISLLAIFCGAILIFFDLKFETENDLRIREDLLNTVFNESPDALFLVDPSTALITNCNDRVLSIFEIRNHNEIIGNNPNVLLRYPYSPGAWKNLKKNVGKKRFLIQEVEFKTASGRVFWGSQAITEINVGGAIYWFVRITDITEKVKDKKTIDENRKMLKQVVDFVPHPIFLKDNYGRHILANKAAADLYVSDPETLLGKRDVDVHDTPDTRKFMEYDKQVRDSGKQMVVAEEVFTDKKGRQRILHTTRIPFYFEDDSRPGVLGIAIDITERVRDKQIIEEYTKMLRQIIDHLPHQIYLKDNQGRFLLVNQAVADMYQLPMDSLIGTKDVELFNEEEALSIRKEESTVIESGRMRFIPEEVFTDKSGRLHLMNTIKIPFYLSDRREVGILGMNIDITEEKLAEKALKDNEAKYRMLMEQASDGIYLCDQEGNILDANVKAAEMFNYSLDEFLSLNLRQLIDPIGITNAYFQIPNNKDRQSIIVERKFLDKYGNSFTAELSVKLLDDGRHQAIVRDITERKRLEKILQDNERKFRSLIENSSDLIMILSDELKLKYVSPSVKRILGFEAELILDREIFDIIHREDRESLAKFLMESVNTFAENIILEEVRIGGINQRYIYTELVASNLLNDSVVNGIIINCHDITKRRSTERVLLDTNFELDSFVYRASHDLKAPLRSVMGLIRLAKLESNDMQQHLYLDLMNKSVLGLDQFIKDLTQFSRNSRLEIEPQIIDFERIIAESVDNLRFMDNVEKVKVEKSIEQVTGFYSDVTRLGVIFNNLISNAFKYHRFEENNPYINIFIKADKDKATINVEDNGQGIDPNYIDRIFEMFYRASETSYGSGLGLYIVRSALVKINGTISVKSELEKGTIFKVEIPNLINKVEV